MAEPRKAPANRWLIALAGLLVWTSADGERHMPRHGPHATQAVVKEAEPTPRPLVLCYPAEPAADAKPTTASVASPLP